MVSQWPGQSCPSSFPSNLLTHRNSLGKRTGVTEAFSASASINKYSVGSYRAPSPELGPLGKLHKFKKEEHRREKKTINKMKRRGMEWETIFANHIYDKGIISTIYK